MTKGNIPKRRYTQPNDEGNDESDEGNVENADTPMKNIGFSIEFQVLCGQRVLI